MTQRECVVLELANWSRVELKANSVVLGEVSKWSIVVRKNSVFYSVLVYLVDRLVACKTIDKHYKVKWIGYKETTWEPAGNIPDELIRDFHMRKTRRRRARHR